MRSHSTSTKLYEEKTKAGEWMVSGKPAPWPHALCLSRCMPVKHCASRCEFNLPKQTGTHANMR